MRLVPFSLVAIIFSSSLRLQLVVQACQYETSKAGLLLRRGDSCLFSLMKAVTQVSR